MGPRACPWNWFLANKQYVSLKKVHFDWSGLKICLQSSALGLGAQAALSKERLFTLLWRVVDSGWWCIVVVWGGPLVSVLIGCLLPVPTPPTHQLPWHHNRKVLPNKTYQFQPGTQLAFKCDRWVNTLSGFKKTHSLGLQKNHLSFSAVFCLVLLLEWSQCEFLSNFIIVSWYLSSILYFVACSLYLVACILYLNFLVSILAFISHLAFFSLYLVACILYLVS